MTLGAKIITGWGIVLAVFTISATIAASLHHSLVILLWATVNFNIISTCIVLLSITMWSDHKWFVKFVSHFSKSLIPVELISYDAARKFTMARVAKDGKLHATTYWMSNIGDNVLLPDGTVDLNASNTYHCYWLPIQGADRVKMILENDYPDFEAICKLNLEDRIKKIYYSRNR